MTTSRAVGIDFAAEAVFIVADSLIVILDFVAVAGMAVQLSQRPKKTPR